MFAKERLTHSGENVTELRTTIDEKKLTACFHATSTSFSFTAFELLEGTCRVWKDRREPSFDTTGTKSRNESFSNKHKENYTWHRLMSSWTHKFGCLSAESRRISEITGSWGLRVSQLYCPWPRCHGSFLHRTWLNPPCTRQVFTGIKDIYTGNWF